MTRQLRRVLIELRDQRLLNPIMQGRASISDDLVFPSESDTPIKAGNICMPYMAPALEAAGLRKFPLHDLRHTSVLC